MRTISDLALMPRVLEQILLGLLAGDGDEVANIFRERVVSRGFGSGAWGWGTAYQLKG